MGSFSKHVTMYSPSVRAAEGLPKTVKTQSVKNALIKGGAKPIELEYAGLDDWLNERPGSVTSEELAHFLGTKGPMGRLQRLDSEGETPPYGDSIDRGGTDRVDADKVTEAFDRYMDRGEDESPFMTLGGNRFSKTAGDATLNHQRRELLKNARDYDTSRLPSDVRRPTEESVRVYPHTMYEPLTESGVHGWRPEDYREILWFDPATRDGKRAFRHMAFDPLGSPSPVSPHNSDWWVRYHLNRTPTGRVIDVQNIQSDVGQDVSALANINRKNANLPQADKDLREGYFNRMDINENNVDIQRAYLKAALHDPRIDAHLIRFLEGLKWDEPPSPFDRGKLAYAPDSGGIGVLLDDIMRMNAATGAALYRNPSDPIPKMIQEQFPKYLDSIGQSTAANEIRSLMAARDKAMDTYSAALANYGRHSGNLSRRGADIGVARDKLRSDVSAARPSVLFSNDAWMQPILRYLAMTSARHQGAPIRMPLGVNVRAIEGMPRRAAANKYENVFIRELQKILKPFGGSDVTVTPGSQMAYWDKPDMFGDASHAKLMRVGPDGERAGATITPREETWKNILKYGMPFFALLPGMAGGQKQDQKTPVTGALLQ